MNSKKNTGSAAQLLPYSLAMVAIMGLYEIDHCTAFGPCSTRGITPSRDYSA